ncbi:M66 family metalloprotease [Roseateles amylovorans]|jgi:Peptidase M66|uniref:Dictomallein n=1 Tax=Roseateles amylovorans TaxID=2978473 RepID=A0ABY6BAQ0_9BURK|nr:M66 family metalloprotease [Roseateles amylovorans]UXH80287.1 M66 family metalloprotease [Roseateles amylovorans]
MHTPLHQTTRGVQVASITLTTLCAAVLVACGGSGDDTAHLSRAQQQSTVEDHSGHDHDHGNAADDGGVEAGADQPIVTGPTTPIGAPTIRTFSQTPLGELSPPVDGALNMLSIELAQTHVLPNGKKTWSNPELSNAPTLRLVDSRDTLALVRLPSPVPASPRLEIWRDGRRVHSMPLALPSALPPTEDGQAPYANDLYSATIPRSEMMPGVSLKVSAQNKPAGNSLALDVAPESWLKVRVLPVYLWGANEINSKKVLPQAAQIPADRLYEYKAMVPWNVDVEPHPAVKVERDTYVMEPSGGRPAFVQRAHGEPGGRDGPGAVIRITHEINVANGEFRSPTLIYSPMSYRTVDNVITNYTGGKAFQGGWWSATGPFSFDRIFQHEIGHNLTMSHLFGTTGNSPYPEASLKGTAWGWDASRSAFIPPWVTPSADNYKNCATTRGRQFDEAGRCVKNSVMENGYYDKPRSRGFNMYSDYEIALGQRELLTKTVQFEGAYDDEGHPFFIRYNAEGQHYEMFSPPTINYALDGIAQNLPRQVDVPIYAVSMTFSNTTPEVNQFAAPLRYQGNMLGTIDPTNAQDRAAITPTGQGIYRNFCRSQGCDFTLRMTYEDGSQRHQLLQRGFRPWYKPSDLATAASNDPLSGSSFRSLTVNVPGDKRLIRVELLSTPEGWKGVGDAPLVVMSRDLTGDARK